MRELKRLYPIYEPAVLSIKIVSWREYGQPKLSKPKELKGVSNMSKYPYYKEYKALESLKSSISSYLGLGYSIYDINNPTVDTIVDYIDTFRVKG